MAGGKGRGATRHAARERAFEVLYSLCFQEAPDIDALEKAFRSRPDAKADPAGVPAEVARQPEESHPDEPLPEPEGFDWELTKGVWKNTAGLDKIIEAHSRHWNMKRIGRIELTILRIAAYEITQTDTPPKAAIDEALKLTRTFAGDNAVSFVNGVLDALAKSQEQAS